MRHSYQPLNVSSSVGAGTPQACRDLRDKAIQIAPAFTGNLNIEVSLDNGAHFFAIITGLTAPGLTAIPWPATHVRVNTISLTGTAPNVILAGMDDNG